MNKNLAIKINNLFKTYDTVKAVQGIDLEINKEDILKELEELNKVPDFTLQSHDGNEYNLRSLEGKVI